MDEFGIIHFDESNSILKNKVELVWINSSYTLDSITLKLIIFLIWVELG